MIQMWAALESMSAPWPRCRRPTRNRQGLRHLFDEFQNSPPANASDEYSDANIAFHQMIIRLGGSQLIADATKNSVLHVRAIRRPRSRRTGGPHARSSIT